MLFMYCGKVIVFYCVLYIPAESHTLLYANHVLQECNLLSCAYISLLQAIHCCVLIINCSKVIVLSGANISLLQAICCYELIINCTNPAASYTQMPPYQVHTPHPIVLCIHKRTMWAV